MKNSIQKSTAVLIAVTAILLASGNVLMAGDLITAEDLAFIKAAPTGIASRAVKDRPAQSAGLISPADYAFVAGKYTAPSGILQARTTLDTTGIITAADYEFLTAGRVADVFSAYSDLADSLAGRLAK